MKSTKIISEIEKTRAKNGALYVKKELIEKLANAQLKEWKKDVFNPPQPIKVVEFITDFLGFPIQYQRLSLDNKKLGATIVRSGALSVFDIETGEEKKILARRGDIFIDPDACKFEGVTNLTEPHEAWHRQFDMNSNEPFLLDSSLTCNYARPSGVGEENYWMERHANYYAVCILMPAVSVRKIYKKIRFEILGSHRILALVNIWRVIGR